MADFEDLRRIGDELEGPLRARFMEMIQAVEQQGPTALGRSLTQFLREGLRDGGNIASLQLVAEELVARNLIANSLEFINTMYLVMARTGIATIGETSLTLPLRESVLRTARSVAMRRGAQRVTSISLDTVKSMQLLFEDALKRGVGAEQLGRELRGSVGLLPSHQTAALNYEELLKKKGVPEHIATNLSRKYRGRLLAWRAEMIARTETMFAVHAGMMAGWVEQVRLEIIQPQRTLIEWVLTEDDRLCDRCAPMAGQQVEFGKKFIADERGFPPPGDERWRPRPDTDSPYDRRMDRRGPLQPPVPGSQANPRKPRTTSTTLKPIVPPIEVYHPPLHPNCRCTLRLVFE